MSDKIIELYTAKNKAKIKYENFVNEIAQKWGRIKPSIKTNIDYRLNDGSRWVNMESILGIEIKRSRNHEPCALCDAMCGKYPKDFIFIGFHPDCICYAVPVLMKDDYSAKYSLAKYSKKFGAKYKDIKPNYIDDLPDSSIPFIQNRIKDSKDPCFLDLNNIFFLYIQYKTAEYDYDFEKKSINPL